MEDSEQLFLAEIKIEIENILKLYPTLFIRRSKELFTRFLPTGYFNLTLTSVSSELKKELLIAKIMLGTLITYCDDFADNPEYYNFELLHKFSELLKNKTYQSDDLKTAYDIIQDFLIRLGKFPLYSKLHDILMFDLQQFFNSNIYSGLMTKHPELTNITEFRYYTPHNMGIIIVGMFDLMASPHFNFPELGMIREFFYLAQRFGSICNTLNTYERELKEGDITNEIIILQKKYASESIPILNNEKQDILIHLEKYQNQIQSFSVSSYIGGLIKLEQLHEEMRGII